MSIKGLIQSEGSLSSSSVGKSRYHLPIIEVPKEVKAGEFFRIRVKVGPHPSTPEHFISRVDVFISEEGRGFNPVLVATVSFTPGYVEPSIELSIKLRKNSVIHVLSYCTLHGIWESRREVRVVE